MFDAKIPHSLDDNTHFSGDASHDEGRDEVRMERFGPCRTKYCGCTEFTRTRSEEQFCNNCEHPRSMHIH